MSARIIESIPKVPEDQFFIQQQIEERLEEWKALLLRIHPTVNIICRSDDNFQSAYEKQQRRVLTGFQDIEYETKDFPEIEQVVFFVFIAKTSPEGFPSTVFEDVLIFCFNDFVFSIKDFRMDKRTDPRVSSLRRYHAPIYFEWKSGVKRLVEKLEEKENSIPPLPETT